MTGQSRQIIASLTGLSRQIICYLTGPYISYILTNNFEGNRFDLCFRLKLKGIWSQKSARTYMLYFDTINTMCILIFLKTVDTFRKCCFCWKMLFHVPVVVHNKRIGVAEKREIVVVYPKCCRSLTVEPSASTSNGCSLTLRATARVAAAAAVTLGRNALPQGVRRCVIITAKTEGTGMFCFHLISFKCWF